MQVSCKTDGQEEPTLKFSLNSKETTNLKPIKACL